MALATRCQTPGVHFSTSIHGDSITISVALPEGKLGNPTEADAAALEGNLHNALELVLAPYWRSCP